MLRKHILHELNEKNFKDLKALLDNAEVKSKCYGSKKNTKRGPNKIEGLKFYWNIDTREIPDSLKQIDNLDITKCNALILSVFEKLKIFTYNKTVLDYLKKLVKIRNEDFGHMLIFETDDLVFSSTVVTLEEIIRKLCPSVSGEFLDRIEEVLNRDSFEKTEKLEMIKILSEQKELFENAIENLMLKLEKSNDEKLKQFIKKLGEFQQSNGNGSIDSKKFEELINTMKSNEEWQKVALEEIDSKVTKIYEKQDEIITNVSKICPKLDEVNTNVSKISPEIVEMKNELVTLLKKNPKGM